MRGFELATVFAVLVAGQPYAAHALTITFDDGDRFIQCDFPSEPDITYDWDLHFACDNRIPLGAVTGGITAAESPEEADLLNGLRLRADGRYFAGKEVTVTLFAGLLWEPEPGIVTEVLSYEGSVKTTNVEVGGEASFRIALDSDPFLGLVGAETVDDWSRPNVFKERVIGRGRVDGSVFMTQNVTFSASLPANAQTGDAIIIDFGDSFANIGAVPLPPGIALLASGAMGVFGLGAVGRRRRARG